MNANTLNGQILLLSGVLGDTRRYRAFHLLQQLRLAGLPVVFSDITHPDVIRLAAASRLVIFQRAAYDSVVRKVIERIRANHGIVIFDTDALVFDQAAFTWINSPDFSDPIREKLYREHMDLQRKTLEMADAVLVSTDYLAEQVKQLGKPVWVHRNAFSLELGAVSEAAWLERKPDPGRVVIGYASGTPTHDRDFALIQPSLKMTLERFPQVELWLLGRVTPPEDWGPLSSRVRSFPLVPWRELPALLARLDINLAPLAADNPFSQSKSEIKYMEAGLVGVPTIASPTDAFRFAIEPGKNGLLAGDQSEWLAALAGLVTDPDRRQTMGAMARQEVLAHYAPWIRAGQLRKWLAEMDQTPGAEIRLELPDNPISAPSNPQTYSIPLQYEQHPTLIERGRYYLRLGDFRRLVGMVWVQIRRWLAPIFPF